MNKIFDGIIAGILALINVVFSFQIDHWFVIATIWIVYVFWLILFLNPNLILKFFGVTDDPTEDVDHPS